MCALCMHMCVGCMCMFMSECVDMNVTVSVTCAINLCFIKPIHRSFCRCMCVMVDCLVLCCSTSVFCNVFPNISGWFNSTDVG